MRSQCGHIQFAGKPTCRDLRLVQPPQDRFCRQPRIRHQSRVRMQATANRFRLHIDLHDALVFHQLTTVRGEIMQSRAETNDAIRLRDKIISGWRGQRAEDVDVIGMVVEQPLGFQGCRQWCFQTSRQRNQLIPRMNRSRPRKDQRPPCRGDHPNRIVQRIPLSHATGCCEHIKHLHVMRHLLPHKIRRHVQHDRATFHLRAIKGARNVLARGRGRAELFEPCTTGFDDLALINALQMARIIDGRVPHKNNHRHMSPRRFGQRGHRIGQCWPMSDRRHAHFARHMRISQRHQDRTALMRGWDKATIPFTHESVHHKEVRIPHEAEHSIDTMLVGRACNGLVDVGGGHFGAFLLGLVTLVADATCENDAKNLKIRINMRHLYEYGLIAAEHLQFSQNNALNAAYTRPYSA